MKNIEIKVNRKTSMVYLENTTIGNDGENLQGDIIFSFVDEFVEGQARLEYEIDGEKHFIVLEEDCETYKTPIKSVLTKTGFINIQLVVTEGIDENDIPIFKSNVFYVYCNNSINAEIEQPDEYTQWIDVANAKLNQVDNVDIDIKTDEQENVIVEITKKDGTKESAIVSGVPGGGEGGASTYSELPDKPKINNVTLSGNKSLDDLNIQPKGSYITSEKDPTVPLHVKNITNTDIQNWNNKSEFSGSYNDLTDIPTNIATTNRNNNFSTSQTINGTLTINGDIVQNGDAYETHVEQIYTEKDEIITRDGATGGLLVNQLTGIRAKKYDGTNDGQLGFDANGEARVGDVGDTQPLLTRDEIVNLQAGQVLVWDGTNLRAVGSSDYVKNTDVASITNFGLIKAWTSTNEDGEIGLNISTEV